MTKLWEGVDAALKAGRDPTILISYGRAIPKKKKRPGRPKKEKTRDPSVALFGGPTRPRCLNPECKARLKGGMTLVCSLECKKTATHHFTRVLEEINGSRDV